MLDERDKVIEFCREELGALNVILTSKNKCKCKDLCLGYVKAREHVFGRDVVTIDILNTLPCFDDPSRSIKNIPDIESVSSSQEKCTKHSTISTLPDMVLQVHLQYENNIQKTVDMRKEAKGTDQISSITINLSY